MTQLEHSAFLDILGVHLWIRCKHRECLDGILHHFSCSRSPRILTPDIVIECEWEEAGRYLFRARPPENDGPLDGVRIWVPKHDSTPRLWTSAYPPIPPLNVWPFAERFVGLHAAAVIAPDGFATLFVGERGSGKSTLALAFVNDGDCELLTDETVFLHRRTRLVEPFPIAIGVKASDGISGKRLVAAAEAVKAVADRAALVTRVVFPTPYHSAGRRVEPMSEAEGFRALLPHHLDVGADMDEAIVTLVHLSTRTRLLRCRYGSYEDLLSARQDLECSFVDAAWSGSSDGSPTPGTRERADPT